MEKGNQQQGGQQNMHMMMMNQQEGQEGQEKRQREQARAHARFTRQRKQELIDKLQNQYTELLNHRLETELKAQRGTRRSRLLKQKMLQLLDLWADSGGTEVKCVDLEEFERNHLLDPQVRALLPVCCRDPQHHSQPQEIKDQGTASEAIDEDQPLGIEDASSLRQRSSEAAESQASHPGKSPTVSLLRAVGDWSTQRSLIGINALRQGMASLSLQPERLGVVDSSGKPLQLRFVVEVSVDMMFAASNAAMCPFWYKSYNAKRCGASREVKLRGMLYCEYTGNDQENIQKPPGQTSGANSSSPLPDDNDDDAKRPLDPMYTMSDQHIDWTKAMDETCDSVSLPSNHTAPHTTTSQSSKKNNSTHTANQPPPPAKTDTVLEVPTEDLNESGSAEAAGSTAISGARVVYDRAAWSREVSSAFAWDLPSLRRDAILPTNFHQALAAMALDGNVKPMLLTSIQSPRKILRVSERYCELTGYQPRELLGNALMWLDPPSSGHRSRLMELVDDLKHGFPLMAMMQHPTNLPSTKRGGPLFDYNGLYTFTHAYPLCDDAGLQAGLVQSTISTRQSNTHQHEATQDAKAPSKHNETSVQTTHILWVLREPPEPKVAPCVSSLLELAVRLARALLVELRDEDTAFCADMFDLLDSVLVQESETVHTKLSSPATMSGRSLSSSGTHVPLDQSLDTNLQEEQSHSHGGGVPADSEFLGVSFRAAEAQTTPNMHTITLEERIAEARERHVVVAMWELYKHTRVRWGKVSSLNPSQRIVTKCIGTIWSQFFGQVREAGADEPFASFIERAKHYGINRRDEDVSFILRRFASLTLNFHRDWVSNGKINDAVPQDRVIEVERAVDVYTKVIDTWPKYAEAWNRRARAFFLLGDHKRADQDLNQALELQPDNPSAWVGKMLVSMKLHEYAPALDAYKRAIKLNPALDIGK